MTKILVVDIETAPKLAYVWRFFKENVGAKQVREHGHIMSFAAKWLGDDDIFYEENRTQNDKAVVESLCALLDKADIVIAHNGDNFDFPQVMSRALVHGIKPPSPYKTVDTLKVARREFSFPSNSLEYLAIVLGAAKKKSHKRFPGFELWQACMAGDETAWDEMKAYNIQDILTLEEIYLKMRPFIRNHPNVAVYNKEEIACCPKCNSTDIQWRGYAHTNVGRYHRFQCKSCGGWGRTRYTVMPMDERKTLLTNAVG